MTYQEVTGTLNPGGHPGSYNGQDAYSDLLVTEKIYGSNLHRQRSGEPIAGGSRREPELYARPASRLNAPPQTPPDGLLWGGETAQTLDSSYYKGTGARNGTEREILAEEPVYMSDKKGHNGITEDGTATTLTAQEKERPAIGGQTEGGGAVNSVVRRLTPV